MLEIAGDPGAAFVGELRGGAPLGVDVLMPRTPEVFEEKVKWKLEETDGPGEQERPNYRTLGDHLPEVRALYEEEARLGWMREYTDEEAKELFKNDLFVAGLAVVVEPTKIRVVHDGSNAVKVNHRIRPRDQTRAPGAGELRRILREQAQNGAKMFAIAGDVSKAHRRIKIQRQDWGFQACRLEPGKVWVNRIGTYSMGSAAYWWARASAAAMVRLARYFLGPDLLFDFPLYFDDFLCIARARRQVETAGFSVFFLTVLGFPCAWKKVHRIQLDWVLV